MCETLFELLTRAEDKDRERVRINNEQLSKRQKERETDIEWKKKS